MNEHSNPAAELRHLVAAAEEAHRAVAGGMAVDLTGLDERIDAVCRKMAPYLQGRDGEERDDVALAVGGLVKTLDDLAVALGSHYRDLVERLEALDAPAGRVPNDG